MGTRTVRTGTTTITSLLLLVGCSPHHREPTRLIPPEHAQVAVAARDAFVTNEPTAAKASLAALGAMNLGLPVADEDVAGSLGRIVVACGTCHVRAGVSLNPATAWAVQGDGVAPEMERHGQGLDQIWSGLVRDDAADLALGARTLRQSQLFVSIAPAPGAEAMDESVSMLADRVVAAHNETDAGAAFADLIRACAACHAARPAGLELGPE